MIFSATLLALSDTHITKDMVYSRNTVAAILEIYCKFSISI
nr:MAG TPA: hypothetical protein [Caudoviricetes sp.]